MAAGESRDYAAMARQYVADVLSGDQIACKWTRLACERQADDLERWGDAEPGAAGDLGGPYYFDGAEAGRVCAFIEMLPHVKGEWARREETIKLEPWQCFRLACIFGWMRRDGLRRFRTAYTEVARKNAKSTIAAGEALFCLLCDDEPGAEVVAAGVDRSQSAIVWGEQAKRMVEKSPAMREQFGVEAMAFSIVVRETGASFKALSRESGGHDGLNIHMAVIDELHAHKTRYMWEVLETAMGAREQPLLDTITTAGSDQSGICYEQRSYVTKILERVIEDETYWGVIYSLDDGDDYQDEAVWIKANPNLDVSVKRDDLARQVYKASTTPAAVSGVLTKRFNIWCSTDASLFDIQAWNRLASDGGCFDPTLRIEDFRGDPCWIGVDLASKVDFNAVVAVFFHDGVAYCFPRFWLPEAAVEASSNSQYQGWVRGGQITETDGQIVDLDLIEQEIEELHRTYGAKAIPYDPHQATQLAVHLEKAGLPMVEATQNVRTMSEPTKDLGARILTGTIRHNGNAVMAWMISNVIGHVDAKDNVYPRRQHVQHKIDGPIALIMALGMALRDPAAEPVDLSRVAFG